MNESNNLESTSFGFVGNQTGSEPPELLPVSYSYESWQTVVISVVCGIIIIGTIVGNMLVCTAIAIVRKLRNPSNLLIVSLAVSDLLVAILDMPFATVYEIMGRWVFGQAVCDTWTSLDVLLCTASILNLCVISVDRYFVITKPFQYAMKRTPVRMLLMIVAVWSLSAIISIPPLFGTWKAEAREGQCVLSQSIGYQFYATIGAFYLPLTVMIFIYFRIYMVSSRIASAEAKSKPCTSFDGLHHSNTFGSGAPLGLNDSPAGFLVPDQVTTDPSTAKKPTKNGRTVNTACGLSLNDVITRPKSNFRFPFLKKPCRRFNRISTSTERKATKTLGIIMGAFTACWLPFFILALVKPFYPETSIPHWLSGLFLWLGYANSFLNPIIYARFNRDFRTPFKYILQCHCADINSRLRSQNFVEQYGGGGGRDVVETKADFSKANGVLPSHRNKAFDANLNATCVRT